jgi:hypothetical protein
VWRDGGSADCAMTRFIARSPVALRPRLAAGLPLHRNGSKTWMQTTKHFLHRLFVSIFQRFDRAAIFFIIGRKPAWRLRYKR